MIRELSPNRGVSAPAPPLDTPLMGGGVDRDDFISCRPTDSCSKKVRRFITIDLFLGPKIDPFQHCGLSLSEEIYLLGLLVIYFIMSPTRKSLKHNLPSWRHRNKTDTQTESENVSSDNIINVRLIIAFKKS